MDNYPITLASKLGNKKIIKELINLGADINYLAKIKIFQDHNGPTRKILDHFSINSSDFFYHTPFDAAVKNLDMDLLKWLIEKGADPSKGRLANLKENKIIKVFYLGYKHQKLENVEKVSKFMLKVHLLIEDYIINNIQKALSQAEDVACATPILVKKPGKEAKKIDDDPKKDIAKLSTDTTQQKELTPYDYKLLCENYTKFKKIKIKEDKQKNLERLEDELDVAIVEYLLSKEEGDRLKIEKFLKENPEL